jgi:hypothetical protein
MILNQCEKPETDELETGKPTNYSDMKGNLRKGQTTTTKNL